MTLILHRARAINPLTATITGVPIDDAPAWVSATNYPAGVDVVRGNYVYRSLISSAGVDPETVPQDIVGRQWGRVCTINKYNMFDGVLSNSTKVSTGDIQITLPASGATAISALSVMGSSANIKVKDSAGAVIVSKTYETDGFDPVDWWGFFWDVPQSRLTDIYFSNVPSSAATAVITIYGAGAEIGELILSENQVFVGHALLSSGTGGDLIPQSTFDFNEFGEAVAVERPSRERLTYKLHLTNGEWRDKYHALKLIAGKKVLAICNENDDSTNTVGFVSDISWSHDLPNDKIFTLKIIGVI